MKQNENFMCISPHFNVNKYCICGTSMNLCPSSPFLSESVAFSGKKRHIIGRLRDNISWGTTTIQFLCPILETTMSSFINEQIRWPF